jgi:hypothetical protein
LTDTVEGQINASNEGITSQFKELSSYYCTCLTEDKEKIKQITGENAAGVELEKPLKGLTYAIKFIHANTYDKDAEKKLFFAMQDGENYSVNNAPTWAPGEALIFIFNGESFELTSLPSSVLT